MCEFGEFKVLSGRKRTPRFVVEWTGQVWLVGQGIPEFLGAEGLWVFLAVGVVLHDNVAVS